MIPVNRPFLPPFDEVVELLRESWDRALLTNNGPFVRHLEQELKTSLGLEQFVFLANGTLALQLAIKALDLEGEVITTPFSYVASTSSIVWENCTPVFADIDPLTLNIDPASVESMVTDRSKAILATHVYGNPCDIDALQKVADKYDLRVIYDASHCFGSMYKGESVLNFGDLSTVSFHATKLFHTVEGGGIATRSAELIERLEYMRNFGHDGPLRFNGIGINAKNSEMHAAVGIANLKYIQSILAKRKSDSDLYDQHISKDVKRPSIQPHGETNKSYYPIILKDEAECIKVQSGLEAIEVQSRRYFYPLLCDLPYTAQNLRSCKVASEISPKILCLPLYFDLEASEIVSIASKINELIDR